VGPSGHALTLARALRYPWSMPRTHRLPLVLLAFAGCYQGLDEDASGPASSTGAVTTGAAGAGPTAGDGSAATGADAGPTSQGPDPTVDSQVSATEAGATDMSAGPGTFDTGDLDTGEPDTTAPGTSGPMTTDPMTTDPATSEPMTTDPSTGDPPPSEQEQLCARWNGDRAALAEGAWSGSVNGCDKGTLGAEGHDNVLKLVNLYRWIADLPAVTEDGARSDQAQACALIMDANDKLDHGPPMNATCWSADGASAAGKSNIAGTAGVLGVDLYMVDPGNDTTIGHRRWILSNSLGPIGVGSTDTYSCLYVIGGSGDAGAAWTAWPPPGLVPLQALHVPTVPWAHVDQTGWTVQSDSIDVTGAQVTVTENGVDKPVAVNPLGDNYGSSHAVRFVPQGWTVEPGKTYDVALSTGGIQYSVTVVDCG
jgi:uncharacterized protein YkwD